MITLTCSDKPWLAHYDKGVPPAIDYRRLTLPQMFQTTVGRYPRHTALIYHGRHITYAELQVLVRTFSITLTTLGIRKGDVVGIWLPNTVATVVSYYAALTIGAIVVMANPLSSDREITHQMNDSDTKLIITLDVLAERAIALREKTEIDVVIHASLGDFLPAPLKWVFPFMARKQGLTAKVPGAHRVYSWKEAMALRGTPIPEPAIHPDEVAVYQYTGGTTGRPKGAMLTHTNLTCMTQMYEAWFQLEKGAERVLAAPPFFHVLGMSTAMNLPIHMGWTTVLIPKPQPDRLLEAIRKFKPTLAPLVPTMCMGILEEKALAHTDLTSFKLITSGASSLPEEVLYRFKKLTGVTINEGYGMTETSPQTHLNPLKGEKKPGSIGIPFPGTEVRIMDLETGTRELLTGEAGEMWFKGPQVTCGYLGQYGENETAFQDGWFRSEDIAWMDEDGYFYIVDRKKDIIISSGYSIYPREVEEVLYDHEDVLKAAVIGVADTHRGENVKAFVTPKPGRNPTVESLMAHCRKELAKYKWPVEIDIIDAMPESTVGKILKTDLRQQTA
ncbi:long-chain-fatty-acid--CoA ligase [Desulfoluna spongiiphila]|uniref:long-chain-fatty-acid--CoA ligase n=1 Tax=Desulfoluna spongiiphila TaxID=419481 RepID=UPI001259C29E|nr:long-chain fatty acid--CoA ligase [Desulfoluna spongiiphila]VVS94155.1 amp-dependent synthetase/ligase [Desulfoluna spongiiphila]